MAARLGVFQRYDKNLSRNLTEPDNAGPCAFDTVPTSRPRREPKLLCSRCVVLVAPELPAFHPEDDIVWILLIGAIAAEVTATSTLKLSDGLTKLLPTVVVTVGYILSFILLAQAVKLHLPVSIAYAIWCGVGIGAITIIGMLTLNEPLTAAKTTGILMIIGGAVTLGLTSAR